MALEKASSGDGVWGSTQTPDIWPFAKLNRLHNSFKGLLHGGALQYSLVT